MASDVVEDMALQLSDSVSKPGCGGVKNVVGGYVGASAGGCERIQSESFDSFVLRFELLRPLTLGGKERLPARVFIAFLERVDAQDWSE